MKKVSLTVDCPPTTEFRATHDGPMPNETMVPRSATAGVKKRGNQHNLNVRTGRRVDAKKISTHGSVDPSICLPPNQRTAKSRRRPGVTKDLEGLGMDGEGRGNGGSGRIARAWASRGGRVVSRPRTDFWCSGNDDRCFCLTHRGQTRAPRTKPPLQREEKGVMFTLKRGFAAAWTRRRWRRRTKWSLGRHGAPVFGDGGRSEENGFERSGI